MEPTTAMAYFFYWVSDKFNELSGDFGYFSLFLTCFVPVVDFEIYRCFPFSFVSLGDFRLDLLPLNAKLESH